MNYKELRSAIKAFVKSNDRDHMPEVNRFGRLLCMLNGALQEIYLDGDQEEGNYHRSMFFHEFSTLFMKYEKHFPDNSRNE